MKLVFLCSPETNPEDSFQAEVPESFKQWQDLWNKGIEHKVIAEGERACSDGWILEFKKSLTTRYFYLVGLEKSPQESLLSSSRQRLF